MRAGMETRPYAQSPAFPLRGRWRGNAVTDEVVPKAYSIGQFVNCPYKLKVWLRHDQIMRAGMETRPTKQYTKTAPASQLRTSNARPYNSPLPVILSEREESFHLQHHTPCRVRRPRRTALFKI